MDAYRKSKLMFLLISYRDCMSSQQVVDYVHEQLVSVSAYFSPFSFVLLV